MPRPKSLPPYVHLRVPTSDLVLHVASIPGSGRPLVLLHGIGMDWRVWQAMSRRLYPTFALYLVDLRGHGESDKPNHGYTLPHYAADIEDLLDDLNLRDVVLVGSSLGGMVAASIEAPAEIVGHRILVDPPLTGGSVRDPKQLETILAMKHGQPAILAEYLGGSYHGAGSLWHRTMAEMWVGAADGVITDLLADRDQAFAIDRALRADESQTLIVQGDPGHGGVLSDDQVTATLRLLPHGSVVKFEGAGHAVHADKPIEFARLLREFTGVAEDSDVTVR